MDPFNVPKAVNRHVYKSLIYLQSVEPGFVTEMEISKLVKKTMRRNKPTPHMKETIHQSLLNLTDLGILACTGPSSYAVRHTLMPSVQVGVSRLAQPKYRKSVKQRPGAVKRGRITKKKRILKVKANKLCNECSDEIIRFGNALKSLKYSCSTPDITPSEVEDALISLEMDNDDSKDMEVQSDANETPIDSSTLTESSVDCI